jgi:hypothetical protein
LTRWKFSRAEVRSPAMNAPDALLCAPRQHLPLGEEFLFLPPWVQPYAYRIVDRLFAHRVIRRGPAPRPLPYGPEIDPRYTAGSTTSAPSWTATPSSARS